MTPKFDQAAGTTQTLKITYTSDAGLK